ncbi:MAG: efflux RND transporter periplasmic adaptor subunit [Halanaerobiales bacterium]
MKKKIIILVVIVLLLGGGFFVINSRNTSTGANANVNAKLVNIAETEVETLETKVSADGNVSAEEEEGIKSRLTGIAEEVYVESGDLVSRGEEIYKIDNTPLINSLEAAELNLQEARGNYESLLEKYNNQGRINNLRLQEARRNLEIAILSYNKDRASMDDQELRLEQQLEEAEEAYEKAEENLEENQYLYEKNAIPLNTLEQSQESYRQAKRKYETAEKDLEIFLDKTMPNTMELAQLQVDNARNNLEYLEASMESDRITEKDLEMSKLQVSRVENQIEEIKKDLSKVITYAPIDGTVIDLELKEGDKVAEGTTVGSIADLNNFIVEAMVDEIDVNEVAVGQPVLITSDSFSKDLEGEVTFISPAATQVGNLNKYRTEISIIDDMGLVRPGMFVNAEIISNRKEDAIAVPTLAVLGDEEKYVFVASDGIAEKRSVEVGLKTLSKVEVSGVEAGEEVIIGPYTVLTSLEEGTPVESVNNTDNQDI